MDAGVLMGKRDGFSLVEVVVALVILAVAIMGSMSMATTMIRTVTSSNAQNAASQLIEDRLDRLRTDPAYDSLSLKYAGTESPVAGWPLYSRVTQLTRTQTTTNGLVTDYFTITVTVTGRPLRAPISRTIVVGSP
jgi:type IV pilus modification protein PilV